MRVIIVIICLYLLGSCVKQNETLSLIYYSEDNGFIKFQNDKSITYYGLKCLNEKNWILQNDGYVEINSIDLIACRRNPNRKHLMKLSFDELNSIQILSRDSCFSKIYGDTLLSFDPITSHGLWTHLWTHLRIEYKDRYEEKAVLLTKEELLISYAELLESRDQPLLTLEQQVRFLFEQKSNIFSEFIQPRRDYRIFLLKDDKIIDSAIVNFAPCYLVEIFNLINTPFTKNERVGTE